MGIGSVTAPAPPPPPPAVEDVVDVSPLLLVSIALVDAIGAAAGCSFFACSCWCLSTMSVKSNIGGGGARCDTGVARGRVAGSKWVLGVKLKLDISRNCEFKLGTNLWPNGCLLVASGCGRCRFIMNMTGGDYAIIYRSKLGSHTP